MSIAAATASHLPDFYLSSLPDDLRADFQVALHRTGLDSEIALLRVQIKKLIKHDPDNLKLMLRIVHLIERLTKCNLQIRKENTPPGKSARHSVRLDDTFYPPSAFTEPDAGPSAVDRPDPASPSTPTSETVSENEIIPAATSQAAAAAIPQHRTWSTSSVAHKGPAERLPASAQSQSLFHKKKHKKH